MENCITDYPCKNCIVLGICTKVCDKLKDIGKDVSSLVNENMCCIDCGGTECLWYDSSMICSYYILCTTCLSTYLIYTMPIRFIRENKYSRDDIKVANGGYKYDGRLSTFSKFIKNYIWDY